MLRVLAIVGVLGLFLLGFFLFIILPTVGAVAALLSVLAL